MKSGSEKRKPSLDLSKLFFYEYPNGEKVFYPCSYKKGYIIPSAKANKLKAIFSTLYILSVIAFILSMIFLAFGKLYYFLITLFLPLAIYFFTVITTVNSMKKTELAVPWKNTIGNFSLSYNIPRLWFLNTILIAVSILFLLDAFFNIFIPTSLTPNWKIIIGLAGLLISALLFIYIKSRVYSIMSSHRL